MAVEVHKLLQGGTLDVTIDGVRWSVAPDPENAQWQMLMQLEGEGQIVIPPAEPVTSALPPITARQLRLTLVSNGFALDQVDAAIDAMEDPQERAMALIEWQYASEFERTHSLIEQVGGSLGLASEQIDNMWQQALTL